MQHVSVALETDGEPNTRGLLAATRGDDKVKPLAINLLVNEGFVEQRKEGQQKRYRSIKPYRETTEPRTVGASVTVGEP